ncbi:hypothetical protein L6Q96_13930 [Candidatus Binatia bacterium]|nr:hypothetical protein [Candidatus Binatia bacterium]
MPNALASAVLLVTLAGAATPAPPALEPAGSPAANAALDLCEDTPERPAAEYRERLERGVRLAEEAIAADDRDAKAHFALFCNLAKLTHVRGLRPEALMAVFRLHREIDRTLELAPDYADALTAKGAFVLNLPRLLGGDPRAAERLLRRALELDPGNATARRFHGDALAAMGVTPRPASEGGTNLLD